jgi:crotonobetainyl-CoA:carnitine CoA-transferase CaiB-like acyl-CoA transferase
MTAAKPLTGLTVVEFGSSVAAPVAGHILGDLGASVLKIENPTSGDDARNWGPPFDEGVSPLFHTLNRNKRSAAINLKDDREVDALRRFIVTHADIVIQNMRPGLIGRYGLDGVTLRAQQPRLIYCNLSAFGRLGPLASRPGYDPLMQACAGLMSVTGNPNEDPVRVGPSIVDQGAGMWCVIGILAALRARSETGIGCEVDTSLYETAIAWVPGQIATMRASGRVPGKIGTENAGIAPYKAYRAADGWIVIAAGNDNLFQRLCKALGTLPWLEDQRFRTNDARVVHRVELNRLLGDIVAGSTVAEIQALLDRAGVPVAPVLSLDQVLEDPQFAALGMLQPVEDGGRPLIGLPLSFDGERPALTRSSPTLGDASHLVLGEIAATESIDG